MCTGRETIPFRLSGKEGYRAGPEAQGGLLVGASALLAGIPISYGGESREAPKEEPDVVNRDHHLALTQATQTVIFPEGLPSERHIFRPFLPDSN